MSIIVLQENLSGVKFEGKDFSGQNLTKAKLKGSIFRSCNFDRTDMTEADCEGSDFSGSSFVKSILTYANFRNAKLAGTDFQPDDCYGITLTFACKTFENMNVGQIWWYSWLTLTASMLPVSRPVPGDLRGGLITLIGAQRYLKLKEMFGRRNI